MDVNIFIWTSRKSVGHKINDGVMVMVKVHGLMVAGPSLPKWRDVGSREASREDGRGLINVVSSQAGYLARPTTKAPGTQIYSTLTGLEPFQCPAYAPSSAENGQVGRL